MLLKSVNSDLQYAIIKNNNNKLKLIIRINVLNDFKPINYNLR